MLTLFLTMDKEVITMKWMIASDIHGSAYYCKKMIDQYKAESADRLLLLGDLLYHGPRNDLPKEYAPKEVIAMLNGMKDELFCVRGNCEAEVDQMVLDFPVMADYALFDLDTRTMFVTHGHIYNAENLPKLKKGDLLLHGHTHIRMMEDRGEYIYLNPGSVSLPKQNQVNSYMVFEDNIFTTKDLDGNVLEVFALS